MAVYANIKKPLGRKRPEEKKKPAEITSKPFNMDDLSREAIFCENRSKLERDPAEKKRDAAKAKSIRNILAFMKRAGWSRNTTTTAVYNEMNRDIIEVR